MMMFRMSMGQNREVFITVRVEESDYFRREGYDVHTTASISISISQALLGGIIRLTGLHEDINLRIPSGISSHMITWWTSASDRRKTLLRIQPVIKTLPVMIKYTVVKMMT